MIAPWYLILTVFYGNGGAAIEKIPMQTQNACLQAGMVYTNQMKREKTGYSNFPSFVCVKTN